MSKEIAMSIISVRGVSKVFGTKENTHKVLDDVSFDINQGEFVSLMGASGSGKSTLLYIIGGLDNPTQGVVELGGHNIYKLSDSKISKFRRQKIGFVFQFYNLVQNLSVEENILLPVIMDGKVKKHHRDRLEYILDVIGLKDKKRALPSQLSGGQQQRVAIARAIIMKPEVLLADEPIGNLDSKSGMEVMSLFKEINEREHITILQVTHSAESAAYGNRIIKLKDGKLCDSQNCQNELQMQSKQRCNPGTIDIIHYDDKQTSSNKSALANRWIQSGKRWSYYDSDGKIVKDRWVQDNIGKRYIAVDGYLVTNQWVNDSKGWVYVGDEGYVTINQWIKDSVSWLYVGSDGYLVTNRWIEDTTGHFYVGSDGYLVVNQWAQHPRFGSVYIGSDGRAVIGN